MPDTDFEVRTTAAPMTSQEFSSEQVELIKRTVAEGTTDDELALFLQVARRTGLDPFARQIYAVVRNDKRAPGGKKMTIQTAIDGYRLIAQRTGRYRGRLGPYWCGPDGQWRDVWLEAEPPAAARVGVKVAGHDEPTYAVATYRSYAQTYPDGNPMGLWATMPDVMIAKCAEAQAIRASFPADTSGVYTAEEMGQSEPAAEPPRSPHHQAALDRVDGLIAQAAAAEVSVDAAKAREYAGLSLEHAQATVVNLLRRLQPAAEQERDQDDTGEVVDAEIVPDPEPRPDVDTNVEVRTRIRTALVGMSAQHPAYPDVWAELVEVLGGHPTDDDLWPTADPERLEAVAAQAEQHAADAHRQRTAPPDPDPQPQPEAEVEDGAYDWRRHAAAHQVRVGQIVAQLVRDWPANSQWNKPSRSADLDQLAADQVMSPILQATIDDIAGDA